MGEAKRRRMAGKTTTGMQAIKKFKDGRLVDDFAVVRVTDDPITAVHREVVEGMVAGNARVPCGDCRECCWHDHVEINPTYDQPEDVAHLDTVQLEDGTTVLRQMPDGRCVHLGDAGCTVYAHRPKACRAYDCRMYALLGGREEYQSGHAPPMWDFPVKSRDDRALFMALHHAGVTVAGPGATVNKVDAMASVAVGYRKSLPKAYEFVDTFDRMTPEDQRREIEMAQEIARQMSK